MKTWAHLLLGIWLILTGMTTLGSIRFSGRGTIMAVLAVVTGLLFLLADRSEKVVSRTANILLGSWLLATGLIAVLHIRFSGSAVVLAVLAISAGVLILIRRSAP